MLGAVGIRLLLFLCVIRICRRLIDEVRVDIKAIATADNYK